MDATSINPQYDALAEAQFIDAALNQAGRGNSALSLSRRTSLDHLTDIPYALGSSFYVADPWNSPSYSRSNSLDFLEATNITDGEIEQLVSEIKHSISTDSFQVDRRNSLEHVIRSLSYAWAGKANCNDPFLVESRAHTLRRLSVTILNACSLNNGALGEAGNQPTAASICAPNGNNSACSTNAATDVTFPNQIRAKRRMSSLSLMASMVECPPDADINDHFTNDCKRQKAASTQQQWMQQQRRSTLDLLASTLLANKESSSSNPISTTFIDPACNVPSVANVGMPRNYGDSLYHHTGTLTPNAFCVYPSVQSLLFQSLSASMKATEESKRLIEEWDKQMGLKRSHSVTVRNTARSRKMLQELMMSGQNF